MRTIAVINQKGGCGKTTVAINLAAVLAEKDKRTLLVDMDPQAHCALGLAVPDTQLEHTIGDVLKAGLDGSMGLADILWQISRNLDLAPGSMALAGLEQELAGAPDKDRRLAQVVSTVGDQYDFCIVDCPPAIGLLTFNALRASQEVIIPVETGYFSMQGAVRQQATIEMLARRANHKVRFRVLATMYDVRTKLAREILSELRRHFGDKLLPVVVHFNAKLKEAASFGQAITEYDPASTGHEDFLHLADWLLTNPPDDPEIEVKPAAVAANPALSRAAELVERARALSARTAALSAKVAAESEVLTAPSGPIRSLGFQLAAAGSATGTATLTAPPATSSTMFSQVTPSTSEPTTAQTAPASRPATPSAAPQRAAGLAERLSRMYGVRSTQQGLLFIQPETTASQIAVAGDFNNWSPQATPLRRDERLGVWQACVNVPPGRYRYRLVVDGKWTHDPYNGYVEANPFGELNNIVEIDAQA